MLKQYLKLIKKHGLKKGVSYAKQLVYIKIKERKHHYDNVVLKYLYENHHSDTLIVVFSACSEQGIGPRYNYINTLSDRKVNKLFILDEYGPHRRGCFYLGNKEHAIYPAVCDLIKSFQSEENVKRTIYVGSSKGGYSALNFGLNDNKESTSIIIGAPQYLLGTFLTCNISNKPLLDLFEWLTCTSYGEHSFSEITRLDSIVRDKIKRNWNGTVWLHYSNQEHTYQDNIVYLVNDLKQNNIKLNEEIMGYSQHGEVAKYFPIYLKKCLQQIM